MPHCAPSPLAWAAWQANAPGSSSVAPCRWTAISTTPPPERLRLSTEADFDEVDELRASCDAILVGAGTIRADNPRLLVRSPERQQRRLAAGHPAHLRKVVLSTSGDLDPAARVFTTGDAGCLLYVADHAAEAARHRFAGTAGVEVVAAGAPTSTASLPTWPAAACADSSWKAAEPSTPPSSPATSPTNCGWPSPPSSSGDARAPRFVHPAVFPHRPGQPMRLVSARNVAGMAVLHYVLREEQ